MNDLESTLSHYSIMITLISSVLIIGIAGFSLLHKKLSSQLKILLFGLIVFSVTITTVYLAASTVFLNMISVTNGPVHWHADFEIWACGNEVNLKDPKGWSNKIGTATLHEHNDKRIHLEGVVYKRSDASLGNFFQVIGGSLQKDYLIVPVNEGIRTISTTSTCEDGTDRELQVFVIKADKDGYYTQRKLSDPAFYVISPESSVPAGDCIVIELDFPKDRTERLCKSYEVAKQLGKLKGEK